MEKLVLELKGVSNGIIKDVNIKVERGTFFVILGPSGTGKTTLLNLICGTKPLTSGEILINGNDIKNIAGFNKWRAANIGLIYEENNLIPTLNAYENVEIPMWATRVDKEKLREKTVAALERVGIGDKIDYFPKKLDIEEQQRVALARAIANEPVLILADEPTGKLDQEKTERLIGLMEELNREMGSTFVVTSHDASFRRTATEVLELSS